MMCCFSDDSLYETAFQRGHSEVVIIYPDKCPVDFQLFPHCAAANESLFGCIVVDHMGDLGRNSPTPVVVCDIYFLLPPV